MDYELQMARVFVKIKILTALMSQRTTILLEFHEKSNCIHMPGLCFGFIAVNRLFSELKVQQVRNVF